MAAPDRSSYPADVRSGPSPSGRALPDLGHQLLRTFEVLLGVNLTRLHLRVPEHRLGDVESVTPQLRRPVVPQSVGGPRRHGRLAAGPRDGVVVAARVVALARYTLGLR